MLVTEALKKRRSIRAFLPRDVEKEKLETILETALQTPSWANSQPWEVFVASGKTLDRIREGYRQMYDDKVVPKPETPRPTAWSKAAIERLDQLHPDMRRCCGDAVEQFSSLNQSLFNAPMVIYICMDKVLSSWSLYDIGAFSQSIMLAAMEHGLSTIPAITLTNYPDILHKELEIPNNFKVTIGIAIGYSDDSNDINKFISSRSPLSQVVRFFD